MMTYEIRLIGPGDSTTSGPLHMPYPKVAALFEADSKTLDPECRIELSDYHTDEVLRVVVGAEATHA